MYDWPCCNGRIHVEATRVCIVIEYYIFIYTYGALVKASFCLEFQGINSKE